MCFEVVVGFVVVVVVNVIVEGLGFFWMVN